MSDIEHGVYTDIIEKYKIYSNDEVDRSIIEDIEWILNKIHNLFPLKQYKIGIPYSDLDEINRYKGFLKKYNILRKHYFMLDEEKIKVAPSIDIKNPYFVLDYLFYHPRFISNHEDYLQKVLALMRNIELITYPYVNFMDEIEFDLTQFYLDVGGGLRFPLT